MESQFSIIIATHKRPVKVIRAINSCLNQTYKNFEVIVIDDGSNIDTFENIIRLQRPDVPLLYVRQVRQQKLRARNAGMRLARFDWIVMLDDDDELMPEYLEEFDKLIKYKPDFRIFGCSADFHKLIEGEDKFLRKLKCPRLSKERTGLGHSNPRQTFPHFYSGCVTMGQFIFKKEDLRLIGYFPREHTAGDFAVAAGIKGYGWLPPEPPRFPKKRVQVMGNPFGDDYYLFYKLTRHYNVFTTDKSLIIKNCR